MESASACSGTLFLPNTVEPIGPNQSSHMLAHYLGGCRAFEGQPVSARDAHSLGPSATWRKQSMQPVNHKPVS